MTEPLNSGCLSDGLEAVFYFYSFRLFAAENRQIPFSDAIVETFINKESELNSENRSMYLI